MLFLYCVLKIIPNPSLNAFMQRENSTRFYDRNGVLLQVRPLEDGLRREYYSLEEIPENIIQAFIDAEDRNFYYHCGVDFVSVLRAAVQNKKAGRIVSGASTITMQLVRIIYPRKKSVSASTKIVEMFRAIFLEIKLSKKKILELYLNSVPFGFQIEGVGSASRAFFGRTPDKLSLDEIKMLSVIPRRPALYAPEKSFEYPSLCPHFINYVVQSYHSKKLPLPNKMILSVDCNLVAGTEKLIQKKLEEYKDARIHNGAACAINNKTGEIFLWVGNASFYDEEHSGQVDGVVTLNQPGSSMKPFLYAMALENGFSPTDVLPDIPQDFGGEGVYIPFNFNNKYNGPVRMRMALASSLNVPAVYLLYNMGVQKYIDLLLKLGFESLQSQRTTLGLSLALGGGEVSLVEMVHAFSVFPNDGLIINSSFEKKKDNLTKSGVIRVYKADTARIMCDILSDSAAREMGFGHASVFKTKYPSIFKTGTSNQFQNIIAVGATTEFTVGVWFGNFGGDTVVGETGSSIPARIVRDILDELTDNYGAGKFLKPKDYKKVSVCSLSGLVPTKDCPSVTEEFVHISSNSNISDVIEKKCNWHYQEGNKIKIHYPSEYQHWANSRNMYGTSRIDGSMLEISFPRNNASFVYDVSLPAGVQMLCVKAIGGKCNVAELYVDGVSFGTASDIFSWNVPLSVGNHVLTLVCGSESVTSYYNVK